MRPICMHAADVIIDKRTNIDGINGIYNKTIYRMHYFCHIISYLIYSHMALHKIKV